MSRPAEHALCRILGTRWSWSDVLFLLFEADFADLGLELYVRFNFFFKRVVLVSGEAELLSGLRLGLVAHVGGKEFGLDLDEIFRRHFFF